ncbi:CD63 antigen [Poecilia latipinna]|uniref:Tetraspanin n=1 Tax=Poecilia latipinna TaxID=48699 RepID=A0A3B3VF30_9TELE|nr:PREDICTED: CD63 antigen [Poecilia latipinna]XP_014906993.1 PREDICTED: CD63 antigen [Poecilia latipinna]
MAVEGGMKFVKYVLFFFNFISLLCGLALIVVGIVVQVSVHKSFQIVDASASAGPILLIVVGLLTFFVAFFGCCGAWKENHCMVATFSFFLSLVVIAEIAAVVLGYVYRDKVKTMIEKNLSDMIKNYKSGSQELKETVDKFQTTLKCCGDQNSTDWQNYGDDGKTVPDSCCIEVKLGCGNGTMTNSTVVYQQGCRDIMVKMLKKDAQWLIIAAIIVAVLQLLGIVFACLLMRGIRGGYEVM